MAAFAMTMMFLEISLMSGSQVLGNVINHPSALSDHDSMQQGIHGIGKAIADKPGTTGFNNHLILSKMNVQ